MAKKKRDKDIQPTLFDVSEFLNSGNIQTNSIQKNQFKKQSSTESKVNISKDQSSVSKTNAGESKSYSAKTLLASSTEQTQNI
ncbi:MAG: hypothetical protein SAJ11_23975, partial [Jaaginema sp. PMC 1078.18]|nr:hypothetical protein [Jaaginema sp. PMC 1078.18]